MELGGRWVVLGRQGMKYGEDIGKEYWERQWDCGMGTSLG